MSNSMTSKLRGMLAGFVAIVAALLLVPGTAFAATWTGTESGEIVVEGQDIDPSGVHVYKVADITLNTDTNVTKLEPVSGLEEEVNAWSEDATAANAAAIASAAEGTSLPDLAATGYATVEASSDPEGVVISNVTAGVYLIQIDTNGETVYQNIVVALEPEADGTDSWSIGTATVDVKSTDNTIDKTVVSVDDVEGTGAGDDKVYEVGDVVEYKVTFAVGADMSEFYLEDTMSGLDFNGELSIVVPGAGENGEDLTLTPNVDYSVVTDSFGDDFTFRVVFTESGIEKAGGHNDVVMTYEGVINDDATVEGGLDNTVSSNINTDGDSADIDLAGIKVTKVDEDGVELAGAVFGLYTDESCTNEIARGTSDEDGLIVFDALLDPNQTYYVKEISAPSGYKLADGVLTIAGKNTTDAGFFDAHMVSGEYCNVTVTNEESGIEEGINLPTTGGTGTIIFTAVGVVIIAGAVAYIVRSRKQN